MGNCAKSPRKNSKPSRDSYDIEPGDLSDFANKSLPVLHFHALLRKVKLTNPSHSKHSVRFVVGTYEQLTLSEKQPDLFGKIRWNIQQKFQYKLTQYELRKTFLVIQLLYNETVISFLKINLYLISTGPYHLDFLFPDQPSGKQVRISFDLKISQMISMKINTQNFDLYETREFIGEQFVFHMKAIIGDNSKTSQKSSKYKIDKKRQAGKPDASWPSIPYEKLPTLALAAPYYELKSSTLKYTLWRIDSTDISKPEIFVGQSYISFTKLLGFDSEVLQKQNQQYQIKNIVLNQKLLNNGHQNGKVVIKLQFQVLKHIKQMVTFVRTESGILKASPVLINKEDRKSANKQIQQLRNINESLINEQAELQKKKRKSQYGFKSGIEEHIEQIQANLQKLLAILKKSDKQSIKTFTYSNPGQLMKSQQILIQIGNKILNFLNNQNERIQILKCKILGALLIRGQLSLTQLGFDGKEQQNLTPPQLQKKKIIACKSQRFSYSLLEQAFRILHTRGIDEQQQLTEKVLAIFYVRVPQFRERFLELINKTDDPRIDEWRGTQYTLDLSKQQYKINEGQANIFQSYFNWQKNFYNHIKDRPEYQNNLEKLKAILGTRHWEARISSRKGAFFGFIKQLVQFITSISIRVVQSSWKSFPGYIAIIKGFLSEMKILQIREYPECIKDACGSLLSNETLLNIFITVIFNKTNIHHNFDVIKILGITSSLFHSLKKMDKKIPSTFDYRFFWKGIKTSIQTYYSYSTAKALYLLYEHFDYFPMEFQLSICSYLLGRDFFKLFLNWSYHVRTVFYHLLIMRISNFFTQKMNEQKKITLVSQKIYLLSLRYSKLLIILQNVKQLQQKQITISKQKHLYKKLKNKLKTKKEMRKNSSQYKVQSGKITIDQLPSFSVLKQQDKYFKKQNDRIMKSLSQSKNGKYNSHTINKTIQNALATNPTKSTQQFAVRRRMTIEQQSSKQDNPQKQVNFENLNDAQQIQMPVISQQDIMYIRPALIQFRAISNQYLKNIKQNKDNQSLNVEIILDESEMKPDDYEDIEQW